MSRRKLKTSTADGKTYVETASAIALPLESMPTDRTVHVVRRALFNARRIGALEPADHSDLMQLTMLAQTDGRLKGRGEGPYAWHSTRRLAEALHVSHPTFLSRWERWRKDGWVDSVKPADPSEPAQRWMLAPRRFSGVNQ